MNPFTIIGIAWTILALAALIVFLWTELTYRRRRRRGFDAHGRRRLGLEDELAERRRTHA